MCWRGWLPAWLQELGRGGYALVVSTENITQNWCVAGVDRCVGQLGWRRADSGHASAGLYLCCLSSDAVKSLDATVKGN